MIITHHISQQTQVLLVRAFLLFGKISEDSSSHKIKNLSQISQIIDGGKSRFRIEL